MLPVPMMNVINGGAHADNPIDVQEFMIMPVGAPTFSEGLRMGTEVFHALKKGLKDAGHNTNVGDEGGFRAQPRQHRRCARLSRQGGGGGGLQARGRMWCSPSMPPRANSARGGSYELAGEGRTLDAGGMVKYYQELCGRYPIKSIEDGLGEDDWDGWAALTEAIGKEVQLVGDDLFVTNPKIVAEGIDLGVGQRASGQGQSDRVADRNRWMRSSSPTACRLSLGDEPSLRRDRGRDHRRSGRRHQLRTDQDGIVVAFGSTCEI